jgi:fibronectin type 3 domain-containing protein
VAVGGTYFLMVTDTGLSANATSTNYGFNVGQYTISGTVVTPANLVSAPSALVAAANGSTSQISLSWVDNATNATGYTVQRSSDGVNWTAIASLAANSTSYVDSGLAAGVTDYYRVQAFNATTTSAFSNQAAGTTVPASPAGLSATAVSGGQINLIWGNVAGETGFRILRSSDGVNWTQAAATGTGVTSYQDGSLAASTTYYYLVQAIDAGGTSASSNQASATTMAPLAPPAAPSNLTATATSKTSVVLSWHDNSSNESGFYVLRSSNGGKSWTQIAQVGPAVTAYTDTAVSQRKTYSYRVYAFNSGGASAYSNVATVAMPQFGPDFSPALFNFQPSTDEPARDSRLTSRRADHFFSQAELWPGSRRRASGGPLGRAFGARIGQTGIWGWL